MNASVFEQIASFLTVKLICSPLGPDISAASTVEEVAVDLMPEYGNDFTSRVIDTRANVVGVFHFGPDDSADTVSWRPDTVVEEAMTSLQPNELLSSTTTILEAIELFCKKPHEHFYIVHVNEIVGILYYGDLSKPLARLAFFALALEIENLALRLCQSDSEGCWQSLSDGRKKKAIELFMKRHGREPRPEHSWELDKLIECTYVDDKANMIWKQKLIAADSRADVLRFFQGLRRIRDRCAHADVDPSPLLGKEELADLLSKAKNMRFRLIESIHTRGADWMLYV